MIESTPQWDADVSPVAAMFADRARARMLTALFDGRRLPASRLAAEAGVSAATASGHLAKLLSAGMVQVESSGRHRFYYLAGPRVAQALEGLIGLTPLPPVTSLRQGTRAARLRSARSCYDHFAGQLGIRIMASLVASGVLIRTDGVAGIARGRDDRLSSPVAGTPYDLAADASDQLDAWGVDLATVCRQRRPVVRFCVDWTEQQHHLAGGLGAALLTAAIENDWVRNGPLARELRVTDTGADAFDRLAPHEVSATG